MVMVWFTSQAPVTERGVGQGQKEEFSGALRSAASHDKISLQLLYFRVIE